MLSVVKSISKQQNYVLYTKPYQLNIWGFRSKSAKPNQFDDEIHVFYKINNIKWEYHVFAATTDPGTYWLYNPMQPQGTAILKAGQYVDAYMLGLHRGEYLALVERLPVTVIRDYNRNNRLDFFNGRKSTGSFGINIHRAMRQGITRFVDRFSAGCQVFANAADFYKFISMCETHRKLYGNKFTYTLVDFRSTARAKARNLLLGVLGAGAIGSTTYLLANKFNSDKT